LTRSALVLVAAVALLPSACKRSAAPPTEEEWAEVEQLAATPPGSGFGHEELLTRATEGVRQHDGCAQIRPDALPSLTREQLKPEVRAGLEAFALWAEQGGAPWQMSCTRPNKELLHVRCLARVGLATATSFDDPVVRALITLGQRLRDGGTSLLAIMMGASLLENVVSWAEQRQQAPSPQLVAAAKGTDLVRALAVEARCTMQVVEQLRGEGGASKMLYGEIEIDFVRRYFVDLIAGARKLVNDPPRFEQLLRERSASAEKHPVSRALPMIASPMDRWTTRLREQDARLRTFAAARRD
jgi:hypothetical protein